MKLKEKIKPLVIRRSNLMVPITNSRFVQGAWQHDADAITLDLEDGVLDTRKEEARSRVQQAIGTVAKGGAEVFVRVNKSFVHADIEASVWPGLTGIMLPRVESPKEAAEASEIMTQMEQRRGIEPGSLQLLLFLESASGIWHIRRILPASPRISQVGLDESDLSANLGISPLSEHDPFVYARGRLAIEATAAGVQPVGVASPMGTQPRVVPSESMLKTAIESKNLGFKGIICPHPGWVAPANNGFSPTESQVEYYTQVRHVFSQAIAAGTAAVPFHGRMIDVPVDLWAKDVLEIAAACAARDEEKRAALELAGVSAGPD